MRSTCYDVQPFSYPSQPIRTPYAGIYVSPCAYTVFVRRSLIRCYNIARGICCVLNYSHYLLRISSKLLCTDRNCSSYRYSSFFHFFPHTGIPWNFSSLDRFISSNYRKITFFFAHKKPYDRNKTIFSVAHNANVFVEWSVRHKDCRCSIPFNLQCSLVYNVWMGRPVWTGICEVIRFEWNLRNVLSMHIVHGVLPDKPL